MKAELKIAWRYLFAKKQFNAIHIITAISSAAVGVVTAAMVCILSVMNGFGVMVEQMFSQFDPDIRVVAKAGKSFIISEEKETELRHIHLDILKTKRELHMLEAEWAHLNDPKRLKALVTSQTNWEVKTSEQLIELDDLPLKAEETNEGQSLPVKKGE